jgi:triosephosphate isomerase
MSLPEEGPLSNCSRERRFPAWRLSATHERRISGNEVNTVRRTIAAGNWKMNMDHVEGASLAGSIAAGLEGREPACEVVLIPPFTTLPAVAEAVEGSGVLTGAQDIWYEEKGAFTGEISAGMISRLGCRYVLVGHSERRHVMGEGPEILSKKLRAALSGSLSPIYCIGETLDHRESGIATRIVTEQVGEVLEGLSGDDMARTVIAYEPVWAIGTGKTATPEDADGMHAVIRGVLEGIFGKTVADGTPILYGGSVKPENAASLLAMKDIDGALVGGASLDAESFLGIVSAA